jgi:hypothetical protein
VRIEDLSHEIKYLLPAARVPLVHGLLARVFRADDEHPETEVVSMYFDTADFASYREKRASEYLKTKWRVRWYRVGGATVGPAFVERKDRVGVRRDKRRAISPVAAVLLDQLPLDAARALELLAPLRDQHEPIPSSLLPCVRIEYLRHRYFDPGTGCRLSLDVAIRAGAVHPRLGSGRDPRPLPLAVLEQKGQARATTLLRPVVAAGCRRAAFSKYAAILEQQGLAAAYAA